MWLDPHVSIDTQLIVWNTGLPKVGVDPTTLFTNKAGEKALSKTMKDKFYTFRGERWLYVENISDDVVQFLTQVLACKLLRKYHKDEVSATVIAVAKKCA